MSVDSDPTQGVDEVTQAVECANEEKTTVERMRGRVT